MTMNIINGIEDKYGLNAEFLCLVIALLLLSALSQLSYGGMVVATQQFTGTRTILVPFIVLVAGFIIGPLVGAFPGFFLAIGIIGGLGIGYAWSRA